MGKKDDVSPSESEWLIMDILWEKGDSVTSAEVIEKLNARSKDGSEMSAKMVRVLMNRLKAKGLIDFTHDKEDARMYHYFAVRTREECEEIKSKSFVESYFAGSGKDAVAALLEVSSLSSEEIDELEKILSKRKGK